MDECAIYLYGVAPSELVNDLNILGIDSTNKLYTIIYSDLKAIVSNVSLEEYNEEEFAKNIEDMNWLKEKAFLHSNITNELFNTIGNIIPVKFGSIFILYENLHKFLNENYQNLKVNIDCAKGKEEWGIKLYGDMNQFIKANMSDERNQIEEQAATVSKGAAYFIKKKLSSTIEEKAKDKIIALSQKIFNEISTKSIESKLNKLLSKNATGMAYEMYLNSVYLINKDDVDSFNNVVENCKKEYGNNGFYIEETGPWPIYNFYRLT